MICSAEPAENTHPSCAPVAGSPAVIWDEMARILPMSCWDTPRWTITRSVPMQTWPLPCIAPDTMACAAASISPSSSTFGICVRNAVDQETWKVRAYNDWCLSAEFENTGFQIFGGLHRQDSANAIASCKLMHASIRLFLSIVIELGLRLSCALLDVQLSGPPLLEHPADSYEQRSVRHLGGQPEVPNINSANIKR